MNKVINPGLPHIGEQIFEALSTEALNQCLAVSKTWKGLAGNILCKRWKGKATDPSGNTKLMIACKKGYIDNVKLLLDHQADQSIDVNAKNKDGTTAFMWACWKEHKDVVKLLLDYLNCQNIELNATANNGFTAFKCAGMEAQTLSK